MTDDPTDRQCPECGACDDSHTERPFECYDCGTFFAELRTRDDVSPWRSAGTAERRLSTTTRKHIAASQSTDYATPASLKRTQTQLAPTI